MSATPPAKPPFDLKSTSWTLTALRLQTADIRAVATELDSRFGDSPGLFDDDPLVVDLSPLRDADAALDFDALLTELRRHRLRPIAVQGGSAAQTAAAAAAGLAEALDTARRPDTARAAAAPAVEAVPEPEPAAPAAPEAPAAPAPSAAGVSGGAPTLVVDKPLRSGQRVYARGGDLVVLAVVSFGAEVIADGSIHVYGPLRGRAIAGARGDTRARIFSACMEPQLVSIAGIYRTTETPLPAAVLGKLAQVRLDGEKILVEPLAG
jgi:septum site-determining protein MinC